MFSRGSVGYGLAELQRQLKQHHIFNWRRLWTKAGINEWEAEPPASAPSNEGSLCEPRETDTQWGHLALFCWAEKQQVGKAVKTPSHQRCNYASFQVCLEAGTWAPRREREAHLIFTYSCNCCALFFSFLQINTSFHTSLHSQRNPWHAKQGKGANQVWGSQQSPGCGPSTASCSN